MCLVQQLDMALFPRDNTGAYPKTRINALLTEITIPNCYRIFQSKYEKNPLGTIPADSRFCTDNSNFSILYAAPNFNTAFIEVVIRDRFTKTDQRKIHLSELTGLSYASITSKPNIILLFLDLRQDGCIRLGAPTDAVNASNHNAGQGLGKEIYSKHPEIDGFLFSSRITGQDNYAIFDRAISKLNHNKCTKIINHEEVPKIFNRYDIKLIKRR